MGNTPLFDALMAHRDRAPAPFHMPGHKGRLPFPRWPGVFPLDVTELPDTGNLYVGEDAIAQAEALWADAWGFPSCQFLTCGSTQGVHAALLLAARRGKGVLVDRACHRSVYNALALYDLSPVYLLRPQDAPVDPAAVEEALTAVEEKGEKLTTVCITSPTYYGVLSDIPAIGAVCRRHGAVLAVDGAHGCHLPFLLGEDPFRGADLVVTSAHKTLPVLGQGALLFGGADFPAEGLRWAASVAGTSSPSYPIMATLDLTREWLEGEGRRALLETAERVSELKGRFPALTGPVDPMRLTVTVNARAADGFTAGAALEARGVFPEMADRDHLVFLFSPQNTEEDVGRLGEGLEGLEGRWPGIWEEPLPAPLPPAPELVLTPAQALTAPRREVVLEEAEGEVAAVQVAPYPPGVPVIAPGERITKKCLAYLREVGYNVGRSAEVTA